jgi:hypothetical protein
MSNTKPSNNESMSDNNSTSSFKDVLCNASAGAGAILGKLTVSVGNIFESAKNNTEPHIDNFKNSKFVGSIKPTITKTTDTIKNRFSQITGNKSDK